MHIKFVEIQNFRKLKAVRVELDKQKTVFVGPNNSGKTSAMVALRYFLVEPDFSVNDFTLLNWAEISKIGERWESTTGGPPPTVDEWAEVLPAMDVWLDIRPDEVHRVVNILPTLKWAGETLGVRLRLEPKDISAFHAEYLRALTNRKEVVAAGTSAGKTYNVPLWPAGMQAYLEKRLTSDFEVKAYVLDPSKLTPPVGAEAKPQRLAPENESMGTNPFQGLVRIDEINAQRGMTDAIGEGRRLRPDEDALDVKSKRPLSAQVRSYYTKHAAPSDVPDIEDIDALDAIHKAQQAFDSKLHAGLEGALDEIAKLNYPGVSNPKITLSSRIRPVEGLNHPAALQYEVPSMGVGSGVSLPRLPEHYNGLGYQNLLSMVFRLLSFRDSWMRVGKVGKKRDGKNEAAIFEPLHLVLIEEPEAHLHVQVQQVFIRQAYEILRRHKDLGANEKLNTQLVVSTHSSHIAHECEYATVRYFKRIPPQKAGEIPLTSVVNLSTVFGAEEDTQRFVRRYLRAVHCDLFFADGVILVEGSAERILLPHFIKNSFERLNNCYISILAIDGSHAHRLRPLVEKLGLTALIITDLDPAISTGKRPRAAPVRNAGLISRNPTLKSWLPGYEDLDKLLDAADSEKIKAGGPAFQVRVAYQTPLLARLDGAQKEVEVLSRTFEDALVFTNLDYFKGSQVDTTVVNVSALVKAHKASEKLSEALLEELGSNKAQFALDLLFLENFKDIKIPPYIGEGLEWLQSQLVPVQVADPAKKLPATKGAAK